MGTRFENEGLFPFFYWAPFGVRLPLVCGGSYKIFLNSEFYLLPGAAAGKDLSYDEDPLVPKFVDGQLRVEYNWLGAAVFCGYRNQFSDWAVKNNKTGKLRNENSFSGVYLGVSIGLKYSSSENEGYEMWEKTKYSNDVSAYEFFLLNYPKTPFQKIAQKKLDCLIETRNELWEKAKKSDNVYVYGLFLSSFPISPFSTEARELFWTRLQSDLNTGLRLNNLVSIFGLETIIGPETFGGLFKGLGITEDKTAYTGTCAFDGYYFTIKEGKVAEWHRVENEIGSGIYKGQYENNGVMMRWVYTMKKY